MRQKHIAISLTLALAVASLTSGCSAKTGFRPVPPQIHQTPRPIDCNIGSGDDAKQAKCLLVLKDDFIDILRQYVAACIAATGNKKACGAAD